VTIDEHSTLPACDVYFQNIADPISANLEVLWQDAGINPVSNVVGIHIEPGELEIASRFAEP
jgi:hypothetical protein